MPGTGLPSLFSGAFGLLFIVIAAVILVAMAVMISRMIGAVAEERMAAETRNMPRAEAQAKGSL